VFGLRPWSLAAAMAAVLLLVACSGRDGGPGPTPTLTPTGSPTTPTTPVPSATATPPAPTATATVPAATATPTLPPATATATPTTAPAPTPTSAAQPGQLIWSGSRGSNMVALTLDMGGRVDPALDIMNWLIENRVPATIFMTGSMADNQNTDAGRQVLQLVDSHRDLFVLANHSYSHPDFRDLNLEQMQAELRRTEEAIVKYTTAPTKPYFRPPYGGQNAAVVSGVASAGYHKTIMWDIDTIDWRPVADGGPTADDIVNKVVGNAQGGSIVLMHLGGYNTYEALPRIVSGLKAKGLTPVTLADMLGR